MNVVNIVGINDENNVVVEYNQGTLQDIRIRIEGNGTFLQKLKNEEIKVNMLIIGGEKFNIKFNLPKDAVLFNSIGMAEGNMQSLRQLAEVMDQTSNPIINHPEHILKTSREEIPNLLSNIKGVIPPQCFKIKPKYIHEVSNFLNKENIQMPFLFRPVIGHGAPTLIRINKNEEMQELQQFAFNGSNEFYVTSFLDFSSSDGIYRKMRFLIIGDEVFPRHLILSKSWQIHTQNNNNNDTVWQKRQTQEEIAFLQQIDLSVGQRLLAIKDALGLDYFGVDCAIGRRGNLIIFESNPFSMVGLGKDESYHQDVIQQIYSSLARLIKIKAK